MKTTLGANGCKYPLKHPIRGARRKQARVPNCVSVTLWNVLGPKINKPLQRFSPKGTKHGWRSILNSLGVFADLFQLDHAED